MNKGFTLIELLAVIVVIALLSLVVITPLSGRLNKMSSKLDEATKEILYTSLDEYIRDNSNTYKMINGNTYYISTSELVDNEALDKNALKDKYQIKIDIENGESKYEIMDEPLNSIGEIWDDMTKSSTYNYRSGTYLNNSVSNNYVYFSNMLWRIMGKNSDGTIRLILNTPVSQLGFSGSSYEDSSVREWLNDYFLSRLENENLIVPQKWYYAGDSYVVDKVGLLNSSEIQTNYFFNFKGEYLVDSLYQAASGKVKVASFNAVSSVNRSILSYIRPVININLDSVVVNGTGQSNDPYVISKVNVNETNRTIKSSNIGIGSNVSIGSTKFVVVEVLDNKIRIKNTSESDVYCSNTAYDSNNGIFNLTTGIGACLNSINITSIAVPTNIYVGTTYSYNDDYKTTIFGHKNLVPNVKVFLSRVGEMFSTDFTSQGPISLTLADSLSVWCYDGNAEYKIEYIDAEVRHIDLYIPSDILILGRNASYPYDYTLDIAY